VEHGDPVGRQLGYPTANLAVTRTLESHDDGVWIALVETDSIGPWVASVSIGRRRTFYSKTGPKLLEAHLIDFEGDLYDQPMRVHLISKIRMQERYDNVEDLIAQISRDVQVTREWAEITHPHLLPSRPSHGEDRLDNYTGSLLPLP